MPTRAKFYVREVSETKNNFNNEGEILTTIRLAPVMNGSDENKEFYRFTPTGNIDLGTVNPKVVKQFEIGKEYYVDFTEAK